MDVKQLLKKVAKEFDLKFNHENKFKVLVLTKREIIIRNFIGGCPDPLYVKYGNKEKNKIGVNLTNFFQTEDYKKDISKPHGCVISQKELKEELKIIPKIPDKKIKKEVENLYNKIKKKIGKAKRLTLIWKPSKKEEKSQQRKEIVLHEFVHELLEDNKIRPKSWRWNEGLITYITNFVINKHKKFEDSPPLGTSKMWNIYARYTHRWAKLLKNAKNSEERKQIISKKIREVDKRHKARRNKK